MKKGGSKQKGAAFERECCKKLSLWLSDGARDDLLWRSAMSGGRATVAHKGGRKATAQGGDISSVDILSSRFSHRFSIECKFVKDLDLPGIIFGNESGITAHWKQTVRDSVRSNKTPMLIAKQNGKPTLLFLPRLEFMNLSVQDKVLVYFPQMRVSVMLFDVFLDAVDPKIFEVLV